MKDAVTFAKLGFSFATLNGRAGFVKLYPQGSIVVMAKLRKGWEAYSPRKSRVRAGVLVSLGAHKGRGLRKWIVELDAIARIPASWIWTDAPTNSLNSQPGLRKVRSLHWKGGPHAR